MALIDADLFSVVSDEAALERVAMEMRVYLVRVGGLISTGAEIAALAWVGANGEVSGKLAPAIRNQVLPKPNGDDLCFWRAGRTGHVESRRSYVS